MGGASPALFCLDQEPGRPSAGSTPHWGPLLVASLSVPSQVAMRDKWVFQP